MSEKRKISASDTSKEVKKRKILSLEVKLNVIKRYESGEGHSCIGRALGLAPSTVRTILRHSDKLKELSKSAAIANFMDFSVRNRPDLMIHMERLLSNWCEEQAQKNVPFNFHTIREKALSLFNALKVRYGESSKDVAFTGSRGWFNNFAKRNKMQNIKLRGERASADVEAAKAFPGQLEAIIEEGGYNAQQIFNCDETGLFWKKMPDRTYISIDEKCMPGFKAAKDRLTLLLGANAAGDFKLKPILVYHSENPRALNGYSKGHLPVIWKSNHKAWVTMSIFEDWFAHHFAPAVAEYLKKKNLSKKALLILDNAPGHPTHLDDLFEHIKVVFLPPNTTSLLQPMDQGVIATVKAYYLRCTFAQAIRATDGEGKPTLTQFWKGYNIKNAIDNISEAWNEVTSSKLNEVWEKICPSLVADFKGFEETIGQVAENVAHMGKKLGFVDLEKEDVEELLAAHSEELSVEDLLALDELKVIETETPESPKACRTLTTRRLSEAFRLMEQAMAIFDEDDPNRERSASVIRAIRKCYECYIEIYKQKKKASLKQQKHQEDNPDDPVSSTSAGLYNFNSELNFNKDIAIKTENIDEYEDNSGGDARKSKDEELLLGQGRTAASEEAPYPVALLTLRYKENLDELKSNFTNGEHMRDVATNIIPECGQQLMDISSRRGHKKRIEDKSEGTQMSKSDFTPQDVLLCELKTERCNDEGSDVHLDNFDRLADSEENSNYYELSGNIYIHLT